MKKPIEILVVEDSPTDADLAKRAIKKVLKDCVFQVVGTRKDFLKSLLSCPPDVILADYRVPGLHGMKALKLAVKHAPLSPFIVWADSLSEDAAVSCIKAGASNYVLKKNIKRLGPAVIHALEERELLVASKHAEEKYQAIFENSVEGVFQSSPAGTYLQVNAAFARLYGYDSPRDVIKSITDIGQQIYVDPGGRTEFEQLMQMQGLVENYEQRNYRKDGTIIWTSTSAWAVRDPDGGVLYYEGFITDITERKKYEEALQNNEKRFRALMENGLDDISLLTADGVLLWESPSTIRNLGYQTGEFVGRNIFEIMHPDDRGWTGDLYARLMQEPGSRQTGSFRLRRADGTWRWVEAIVTNMLDEPSVNAIVVNYRDVTESREAEEALRESQRKYQHLVETSHDLIWSTDAEGRITFINRAAKEIYGYEPEELIGRSFFELMDLEHYGSHLPAMYQEVIASVDGFQNMESFVRHRDGRQIILSANSIVVRDASGNILGITGSSRDVTAYKQAENALKEERNLLRTLIDNLPDRIYVMDTEARKKISNTADWKACGGKTMEDVIGKTDFDTYPRELAEQFWKLDQAVLGSGEALVNYEEPGLDAEGNLVSILTTKIPLRDDQGKVTGLVGIGRDITERKQAESRINDLLVFNEKILNHSSIGILTYKATGACVYANEKAAAIVGADVGQLLAQDFRAIDSWKKSGLYDLVERAITTQLPISADIHHISSFGKEIWITAHCVTFKSKEEDHVVLCISDISDRKRAEEKLLRSQQDLAQAQAVAKIGSWTFNIEKKCVSWSDELYHIFGVEKGTFEITYDAFVELVHPDDRVQVRQTGLDSLQDGQSFEIEYRIITPGGEIKTISEIGYAVKDASGKVTGLFGTAQDITQRKQTEIEREALLEIMQGLANTNDLQELLRLIHHSIEKVVYAENFFVILRQANTGLFEEIYSVDQYDPPEPPSRLEKSITAYVFRNGEPLLLTEQRFRELASKDEVKLIGTNSKSWLGVPLKTSSKTIGVMAVQDYENDNRYSEHDKDFLTSIAAQVALVIERKQAEEALREREEQYRAIFEGVQDAIFVESVDGRILMVNERACEMFGYSREEFLTKRVTDLVPEGCLILGADGLHSRPSPEPKETLNKRANGEVFPIEISGRVVVINGETLLLAVVRDVTERKQAEKALLESISRFRTLFEASPDAILLIDPSDNWNIVDCNSAACQMNGYHREELIGQPVGLLNVTPGNPAERAQYIERVRQQGILRYENTHRRKDGSIITVDVSTSLLRFGNRDLVLGIDRDITERKRTEAAEHEQRVLAEALRDTAETLSRTLDYGEVLDHILAAAKRVVPHDAGTIMLIEEGVAHIVRAKGYGQNAFGQKIMSIKFPVAEITNLQQMLETGQPVVVYDTHCYRGWKRMPETDWLRSSVGAPICIYGEVIGFILLDSQAPEFFTPVHAERLQAFANQAALAIHNARLLQHAQEEIAERKQAELELRASEERFRQLAENLQEAFWMTDTETGQAVYLSPAAEIIWGRPIEYLMKDSGAFINSVFSADRENVLSLLERQRNGERAEMEYRVVRPDGSLRWVWDRAFPIFDETGRVRRIAGISADITERKQAEIELQRRSDDLALLNAINQAVLHGEKLESIVKLLSEEVKRIFSALGCTIYILSPDKQFITLQQYLISPEIRERVERLIGYEIPPIEIPIKQGGYLQQILSSRQSKLVRNPEEIREWIAQFVETRFLPSLAKVALRKLIPQIYKVLNIKSTILVPLSFGSEMIGLLDVSSTGLLTEDDLERIENMARQLTSAIQSRQADEALRESENKAQALLNALPDLMFRLDREGTILDYKADKTELYAQLEPTLINKKMREIAPPEFTELIHHHTLQTLESKTMQVFEYQLPVPGRGLRDYEARMVSSGQDEVTAIVRDITEHKRNEIETQRRADEFAALYTTARELAAQYNLPTLLNTIVERACNLLQASGGGVYLYEEARNDLQMVLALGSTSTIGARLEMGEGMAGRVAENRELLIVDDYHTWESRSLKYEDVPFRAVLQVPMLYGGKLVGVLVVHEMGESERKYTQDDAHVLSLFAEYAASAVHAARLMEETRRGAEETSALLKTSLALTNLDLKATLQIIGNSAKTLFAADGCRVFLMEPDRETLRCVLALQENFIAFSNLRIKLGDGVTGSVAATGKAEIVNEMHNDPRAVQVPGTPDREPEAIMFAPLKERDRTIGVLSIRRAGEGRPFQPGDLELLEAFASMAASAVSKARLFEETQRRLAELEALYENGLAVGRLLKPAEIGDRVIETFARYLRWHHVTIRLRRGESDDLELVSFNLPTLKEEDQANTQQHFVAKISKVSQGLSGWVIQTGQPLRTGNVHAHSQYVDIQQGIQSGLYMPLKVGERVIGVISVESELPDAFSEQDERLLATLASQAAIAFENARLYQAIEQELTERKRAEDALRASETHYRELADSITDVLFELDQNLQYTHWNKASEMLTGIPARDAIGKSMHEIFGESNEQKRIGKIYEDVLQNRHPRTLETKMILNGQERFFEVNAYPSTRGVSVVANDVTDRRRSESIMQKRFELMEYSAHHSLSELMQKTTDEVSELTGSAIGFFHFVLEDQVTMGMQTWSTSALKLFQVPFSEGEHLPLDKAGVWADAVRQRRPLIQNSYESLLGKKGLPQGHMPIAREIVIPIIRNERVMAVMGIGNKPQDYTPYDLEIAERLADYAWDITERKQMELALETERRQLVQRVEERTADLSRANSNLARALRVKDEFLANMSHELRTPLNAILGLSESLGEQIAGPLNEKQQKYITTIGESGHHLLALINDILDLAKIEAGQITLDINKMDIHTVCQSSLRMIKQLAQKKNQEVILDIEDGVGLMWADERRLKQMIVNLLGNAVKFTPENGTIGLEVRGDRDANKITITVWDSGIGIRQEDLSRLFQPFVQLDSGLARETTGTGLGLALVAQMARLHGGSVSAVSEVGRGSRFSIVLPWEPALALDTAARLRITGKFPAIKPDDIKKPTILLVEDTKEVIMMIQDYLELAGYKIVTAQDGVDGLVQAKLSHPDLILMDVQMPRMDGLEATRKLRSEAEFRDTPIIALTALAMPNDRERCLAAGMDEYVSKPVNLKALVKLVQSCLFNNGGTRHP